MKSKSSEGEIRDLSEGEIREITKVLVKAIRWLKVAIEEEDKEKIKRYARALKSTVNQFGDMKHIPKKFKQTVSGLLEEADRRLKL